MSGRLSHRSSSVGARFHLWDTEVTGGHHAFWVMPDEDTDIGSTQNPGKSPPPRWRMKDINRSGNRHGKVRLQPIILPKTRGKQEQPAQVGGDDSRRTDLQSLVQGLLHTRETSRLLPSKVADTGYIGVQKNMAAVFQKNSATHVHRPCVVLQLNSK